MPITLQYRKRYELLQRDIVFAADGSVLPLQYRKRYELLQLENMYHSWDHYMLQYRKRYELLQRYGKIFFNLLFF